jgi:hypothetical protein
MRGGRLNDEPIVLPRGPERIPQSSDFFTSDFFTEGALCFRASVEGEGGITKATSPCVIGSGKASFLVSFGGTRAVGQGCARNTHPDVPLLSYVGLRTNRGSCSEELRSLAYGRTEWARCNAQFGPIPDPARLGPGAPQEGLRRRPVAERTSENPVSRRSSVEPRSDERGFLG